MANQTRIIKIDGMTCGGCVASVHTATADIDGLDDISIELADNQATVTFDDSKTFLLQGFAEKWASASLSSRILRRKRDC